MNLSSVKELVTRLRIKNSLVNTFIPLVPFISGANMNFQYAAFIFQVFLLNCYVFWINDYYDAPFDKEDLEKRKRNIFCNKDSFEAKMGIRLITASAFLPVLIGLLIDPVSNFQTASFILLVICLNFYIFWINDYNIPFNKEKIVVLACALFTIFIGLFIGPRFTFFAFGFLIMATLYVHPISRGKQRRFWDLFFHIAWPVITFYYSYTYFYTIDETFWLFSLFFACSAIYSQIGQQLRDFEVDVKTKNLTTTIYMGKKNSERIHILTGVIFFLMSSMIAIGFNAPITLSAIGFSAILIIRSRRRPHVLSAEAAKWAIIYIVEKLIIVSYLFS